MVIDELVSQQRGSQMDCSDRNTPLEDIFQTGALNLRNIIKEKIISQ